MQQNNDTAAATPPSLRGRSVRVDDELWDEAMRVAAERGDNVSELVRAGLRRYVQRHSR